MSNTANIPGRILGDINPGEFLAHYWQKNPLLIRNALSEIPTLSADELAGLALEDYIESRLVLENQFSSNWQLHQGPFSEQDLQDLPASHWTLLVQAVDQWLPEVNDVLDYFGFLPRWRLDDIMISLSADQGSVGPHFDNYDVFLLQTNGYKRWRTGQHCDDNTQLIEGAPLHLLRDFQQHQEHLLGPGDMLYLPPRLAHWGVAQGDNCMTFSIGFRAPTAVELLDDLVTELLANSKLPGQPFTDPPFSFKESIDESKLMASGEINDQYMDAVKKLLVDQLSDDKLLSEWFARFMTARKYPDLELIPDESKPSLPATLTGNELLGWHPASRHAVVAIGPEDKKGNGTEQTVLAVDGELYPSTHQLATLLSKQRQFSQQDFAGLGKEEKALLDQLVRLGSLQIIGNNNS